MATTLIRDVGVYADQYDFSGYMNQMALNLDAEAKDVTVFRNTNRVYKAGLLNHTFDLKGFVDLAEINTGQGDSIDEVLYTDIGLNTPIVTIAPTGISEGAPAYFGQFAYTKYAPGAQVGDMLAFDLTGASRSRLTGGQILNNGLTPVTASGTSTKLVVGAVTSSQQVVAHLHVVAFNGTSLAVKVQSDANASAGGETDRLTFTTATGVTSQRMTLAGAITDTYWRLSYTFVGTSVTFVVALGIETQY